jgi:ketopantoate reductase
VTLVWKNGFEQVHQYGISFRYVSLPINIVMISDDFLLDPTNSGMNDSNHGMVRDSLIADMLPSADHHTVVKSPEEAAGASRASFDYVLLCVKALPDVYDLASVIESVVAPQHTCILVNTTHTLGIESYLEQRFPTNVVLSLVSAVSITQLGASEFEHKGSTELFVGAANKNPSIPASIQTDMAEALAMTLKSGQVDCEVSANIRQQQYERMIG